MQVWCHAFCIAEALLAWVDHSYTLQRLGQEVLVKCYFSLSSTFHPFNTGRAKALISCVCKIPVTLGPSGFCPFGCWKYTSQGPEQLDSVTLSSKLTVYPLCFAVWLLRNVNRVYRNYFKVACLLLSGLLWYWTTFARQITIFEIS